MRECLLEVSPDADEVIKSPQVAVLVVTLLPE